MSLSKMVNKIIAVLVIALLALLAVIYVLNSRNDLTQEKLNGEIVRSAGLDRNIKTITAQQALDSAARTELLKQLRESKNEIETLRGDLADKRKRLSIGAVCPGLPKADNSGRVETVAATLDARAERAYLRLRELIAENEAWVGMCFKKVNAN